MSPIGQNIMRLARRQKLSIPKLAMRAGVDKGNLSRIIKDGSGYSSASLQRIAEALDTSIADLFAPGSTVFPVIEGLRRVPVLNAIQAGEFKGVPPLADDHEQEFTLTSSDYSAKTFAMRVSGESMVPDFYPNDLIIVDPDAAIKPGCFVVAVNGSGEATLKRFAERGHNANGQDVFELVPSNPVYGSWKSDVQELRIIGVVRERTIRLP